jgi:NTE family protein
MNVQLFQKTKTIWLCLGGWWARWLSHIWVLKALAEHNIKPTHISGTSMWAIIAVLYASGYTIDDMIHTAKNLWWKQILPDWLDFFQNKKKWLLSTKHLHKILSQLPYQYLEQLSIPTRVSVTSVSQGNSILYDHGEIIPLVMASSAIPWLFDPVKYDWHLMADGGIANNFPLEPLMDCDLIIGSDVNHYEPTDRTMKTQELISRSLTISFNQATVTKDQHCHIFIQPPKLHKYTILDFDKADKIIQIGYEETIKQLKYHNLRLH